MVARCCQLGLLTISGSVTNLVLGRTKKKIRYLSSSTRSDIVVFDDLCICINCEYMIHVDDSSNGICGECGCGNPEHPGYDDIGSVGAGRDYDFYEEFNGSL